MKPFCVPEDRPKEKSRRAVKRMRISTEKSPLLTTPDLNWRYQANAPIEWCSPLYVLASGRNNRLSREVRLNSRIAVKLPTGRLPVQVDLTFQQSRSNPLPDYGRPVGANSRKALFSSSDRMRLRQGTALAAI